MLIRIQTFYDADPDPTLSEMNRDEPYLINSQALSVRGHKAGAGRVGEGAQHCSTCRHDSYCGSMIDRTGHSSLENKLT